jgi:ATP-dependent RNA helicase DDX60
VIKHVQRHAEAVEVHVFNNIDDAHFTKYLQDSAMYFTMCSDGASYRHTKQKTLTLESHALATNLGGSTLSTYNLIELRSNIHKLMSSHALDAALLNSLVWRYSKVFAFVLERKSSALPVVMDIPPKRTRSAIALSNGHAAAAADAIPASILQTLRSYNIHSPLD